MFTPKTPAEKTPLQEAIDSVLIDLQGYTAETEDHAKCVAQLTELYALKELDKPKSISPDTKAIVACNILVTALVIGHERTAVITTKAKDFWLKLH
jgi:hypothetical protein